MKLKVSKKTIEKYSIENEKINEIVNELVNGKTKSARDKIVQFINTTEFRTKFDEPEKDITKYIALLILKEEKKISTNDFIEFIDYLWEIENASVREIGSFIMGKIYERDPELLFEKVVEISALSNTWNDIDNWAGYSLEEYAAKDYDKYLEKLKPLINNENQWVRRLAIVVLGRAFFITKTKENVSKCFEAIEPSFTDKRKIVLDANSWIIGTLGFRVDASEVVKYFKKYQSSEDYTIIKLFCDVVRRSKLVRDLPNELLSQIDEVLHTWLELEHSKIQKTVQSAIDFLSK